MGLPMGLLARRSAVGDEETIFTGEVSLKGTLYAIRLMIADRLNARWQADGCA